jgi:glycosyltransferase involved in cell wall biosynthesis
MSINLSVVIPIYNVEQYLRQCLDSIGVLGRDDVEVILVNDGSTDGSRNICVDYVNKWSNVTLIDKENGGLSDARNKGTEVAAGEYIYYLDSDDWLEPDAIDKLYRFAVENDCDIVQGSFYYAFEGHVEHNNRFYKADDPPFVLNREEAMRELIKNYYVLNFAWGKVYRTSLAKSHQFPFGKYFEDSYWQHLMIHDSKRYGVIN